MPARLWICLAWLCWSSSVLAETIVPGGPVSGTWTVSGSPYRIQGDILVSDGLCLAIEPGVEVIFGGHHTLAVHGRLLAVGTATDSILFAAEDAAEGWAGIRLKATPATNDSSLFVHCRFQHGRATGEYPDHRGGAIYIEGFDKVRIARCHFTENSAAQAGGLYCGSGGRIFDNRFTSNEATGDHGYDGEGAALWVGGTTHARGNAIEDNYAWGLGSIVALTGAPLFEKNTVAENNGTGIRCYSQCTARMINCMVTRNIDTGILCGYGSAPEIIGCLVSENENSGLYFSLSFAVVVNSTISGNTAVQGGGVFCSGADPIFLNTILWGNSAGNGNQLYLHLNTSTSVGPDFYFCDVEGGVEAFGLNTGVTYGGQFEDNIDVDPCFQGLGAHPYALTDQSYCVNAGRVDNEGLGLPEFDLAGSPRVYEGFRVDIGAYEYPGSPAFADMPLFTPEPGWFADPQIVSLATPTAGASIHYTLDGSEPTQASPLYVDPLEITCRTSISARAFHAVLPPSLITRGVYRIGSELGGEIFGTLAMDHSPYRVVDDLEVPLGETLIVDPGVVLSWAGHHLLEVQGRLWAVGTSGAPILFTAEDPATGWAGIRFSETPALNDSSRLQQCVVEHGKALGEEPDAYGGGLMIRNFSKLAVTECLFRNCTAHSGGGMACYRDASPLIANNAFCENVAVRRGGGLYVGAECAPIVRDNSFLNNIAAQGGGLGGFAIGSSAGPCLITGNTVCGNQAVHSGGHIPAGGGMYLYDGGAEVCDNHISKNASARYGAGIHVEEGTFRLVSNVIAENVCALSGGGVVYYVYAHGQMVNNLILCNQAPYGGGLFISHADEIRITNNTLCRNTATHGGGFLMTGHSAMLRNSILWDNEAPDGPQLALLDQPMLDVAYCDLQGGLAAVGGDPFHPYLTYVHNLDAEPLFVGAGAWPYALDSGSPCIDAGIPDTTGLSLPETDLAGNPRLSGERIDMGAFEAPEVSAIELDPVRAPLEGVVPLRSVQPNPFRAGTCVAFANPSSAQVDLKVYDLSGRLVRTLITGTHPAGRYCVRWDGRNEIGLPCAAGCYFVRLTVGDHREARPLVRIR